MVSRQPSPFLASSLIICITFVVNNALRGSTLPANIQPMASNEEINSALANQNVLLLLPAAYNSSNIDEGDNFSLFKLNTDVILAAGEDSSIKLASKEDEGNDAEKQIRANPSMHREARKINLLGSIWNKPKFSPLYLVNGTVCRFINSSPICTTLSTTGLLPLSTTIRPTTPIQGQLNGNNNNLPFNNQNLNYRPAALVEEDSLEVNVEGANNLTESSAKQSAGSNSNQSAATGSRQTGFSINRRPLKPLLALRRPVRHYAVHRARSDSVALN